MGSGRTTLVVLVGLSACAATAVLARDMVIAPKGGVQISESPKEVMDQGLQSLRVLHSQRVLLRFGQTPWNDLRSPSSPASILSGRYDTDPATRQAPP